MNERPRLRKELSLFGVYTLATGATLSSGFFLLPGLAAVQAGAAVPFSYMLAIIPLIPGMLCKIELSTAMPRAGGEYYFLDRSLGPLLGTISGFGSWCGLVLKTAFALIGIGAYLAVFFEDIPMTLVAAVVTIAFGVLNLFGAHKSTTLQTALVIGLLSLMSWFLVHGVTAIDTAHFATIRDTPWSMIFATSGMVCVSFMGLTKVASVAEEVKDPERNLSLGVLLAVATAVVVYGVGTAVLVGTLGPAALRGALTPAASAAEVLAGHAGAVVMTVAAILAFLSVGNAGILSASRYPLAMSRDHLLPGWLSRLNRHGAPHNAVIVTTVAVLVLVTVDPSKVAKLASTFLLMLFALNCLAVIVMRESRIPSYDPGFRSPWYPWLPIAGMVGPTALIVAMGFLEMVFATGVVAVGALWFHYYARKRIVRGGAIYHLFARLGALRFEGLDRELREILKEKGLRTADPYDEIVARAEVIDGAVNDTFEDLVQRASAALAVHLRADADQLFATFMEGTRVGATPVSKGVALPHLRVAGLEQPLMVIARSRHGVCVDTQFEFLEHVRDQKIYAVIFLVSSEDDAALHLRVLARIARQVDQAGFIEDWLETDERDLRKKLLRDDHYLVLELDRGGPTAELVGRLVRDLDLPANTLIAMIDRGSHTVFPQGDTLLRAGDGLTIVGEQEAITTLKSAYQPTDFHI